MIMKWLLKIKHWQLFILMILPSTWESPSPLKEIVHFFSIFFYLSWIYSIGVCGYRKNKLRLDNTLNINLHNVCYIFLLIAYVVVVICAVYFEFVFTNSTVAEAFNTGMALISFGGFLYLTYFAASLMLLLTYKNLPFKFHTFKYVFLFCFFMFGIWYIQPRINNLFAAKEE